ncbi:unnamed protein product [Paramecium sonneborni]|uniref:Uncharacterized protein n=1 Tax=Paramecium sonneborni TaxID=65129 RepID=A0A8S1QSJ2_9CILI|nr:unnamed protein product [Paramecium sonneborni]
MRQKHLFDDMINVRDKMNHINNRLKTNCSTNNYEYHHITNLKIKKYCHLLIQNKPPQFQKYFISDQFLFHLLDQRDYEKILQIALKFIVNYIQNQQFIAKQTNQFQLSSRNTQNINQIIRDIVSPIKCKIQSQSQFFDQQLKNNNRSCQTQPCYSKSQQMIQFNLALRQQSSIISSIQQDNLNSPKFNENTINAIDEISFEKSCMKKRNENLIENQTNYPFINRQSYQEIQERKSPNNLSLLSTPKQKESENKKLEIDFNNFCIPIQDTKRKEKNKSSFQWLSNDKLDEAKLKKQLPQTLQPHDFMKKRQNIPGRKTGTNLLLNY